MKQVSWAPLLSLILGLFTLLGLGGTAYAGQTCASQFQSSVNGNFSDASFFSSNESVEYQNGFLVLHLQFDAPPGGATSFQSGIGFVNDSCFQFALPTFAQRQIDFPAGMHAYSIRFTSLSHYDVWNDDSDTMLSCTNCSQDIQDVPVYSSIFVVNSRPFGGQTTKAYSIEENPPAPPVHTRGPTPNAACPSFNSTNTVFDNYSFAEYQNGLLNYHFRYIGPFRTPGFAAIANIYDVDCNFVGPAAPTPSAQNNFPYFNGVLTGYTRYFSIRFSSATHFDIWNDETNTKETCRTCSVDLNFQGANATTSSIQFFLTASLVNPQQDALTSNVFPIVSKTNPVIIIPGILGSAQKNGTWVIDPIFHTYDNLIDTLKANGYVEGKDLFTFPYDWRQSNASSSILLKQKIDSVKEMCSCTQVDLVAHSMGGLIARDYAQSLIYGDDIGKLIFLGTPQMGSPKAYLMWEGGATGNVDKFDFFFENYLTGLAKENGYSNAFNYVRNFPITSVKELLPINNYLEEGDSGVTRQYYSNYPRNIYLENLNFNVNRLLNSEIETTSIVGNTGSSTIEKIKLTAPFFSGLWENGYPENFDMAFSDHGLKLGIGDNTVLLDSASSFGSDTLFASSTHNELPSVGESLIYKTLTGTDPVVTIKKWNLPSLKIIVFKILSPADIMVIAPDGKKMGKDFQTGQEFNEIPGAFYSGYQTEDEYITIPDPLDGQYQVITQGTGNGGKYTVASAYISDATSTESDFVGQTSPGLITSVNVVVDNSHPENILSKPSDITPPAISILSPTSTDYLRSQILPILVTATDTDSGVFSLNIAIDGTSTTATSTDLFFLRLGSHLLSATATDFENNQSSSSTKFRVIATVDSTLSDLRSAYALGWITNKKSLDQLTDTLNKASTLQTIVNYLTEQLPNKPKVQKRIERIEKRIDKLLGKNFVKELDRQRGKTVNEKAYQLLLEDINWLLDN